VEEEKIMPQETKVPYITFEELLTIAAEGNYGAILHYFRLQMGWTAITLALLYAEALQREGVEDSNPITKNWIYMMEKRNLVPVDDKRRWILARLLDIPPVLFGLDPLSEALQRISQWEKVDVEEYHIVLARYCQGWHSGSVLQAMHDIKRRIDNLHNEICSSKDVKKDKLQLVCGYHILMGQLALAQMDFDATIEALDKAITIAQRNRLYDIWAYALHERGCVYRGRGEIIASLKSYDDAQSDFAEAALNYHAAQQFESKLPLSLRGIISLGAGMAYAYTAQDEKSFKAALETIDTGKNQIGKVAEPFSIPITAILDEERYHLDRSTAYLAYATHAHGCAKTAREELDHAARKAINSRVRNASSASRLARSYMIEGKYEMTVAYTESALSTLQGKGSALNLTRLAAIYHELRRSPYGKSTDVARLGISLLKIQKPMLFN
jgi:tetratricopeptide (TPR) repeat protein